MNPTTVELLRQRSPTRPPLVEAGAPSWRACVSLVAGLLTVAGALAWIAAPLLG